MISHPDIKPPVGGMGGTIHDWEPSLDPWHTDAFPDGFKEQAPHKDAVRKRGWMAVDAYCNPLMFVAYGEEIP